MTVEEQIAVARLRQRLPAPPERRRLRRLKRVSLAAIAAACDVSPVSVSRWETGDRMPRGDHLREYLKVLGLLRK